LDAWSPIPKHVARRISEMIASRNLGRGARLPSQRELSSEFGVSRASLREALLLLEAAGLLKTEPGRGTFVAAARDGAQMFDADLSTRMLPTPTAQAGYSKLDVCQFRYVVEGQCARLAAMRITEERIEALERNLGQFKNQTRAGEREASAATDFEFHQLFVQFAEVPLFTDLHLGLRELIMGAVRMPSSQYNRAWEPVVEHERILEAIKRRDPDETRYYMQSHIVRSAERLGILLADDLV
jgi:GntR family transcriptional repressor for pyruvate dehydrogenase complex